jgi:hypothetical protein
MDDLAQPPTLNATPALVALVLAALSKVSNLQLTLVLFTTKKLLHLDVWEVGCLLGFITVIEIWPSSPACKTNSLSTTSEDAWLFS